MSSPKAVRSGRRAAPLPPEERREALIGAAIALIREHHELPTTRQIATTAGVAEGTIFRVFATKDELFDAVIDRTFDAQPMCDRLDEIDGGLGLEGVMLEVVTVLQGRFREIFDIMGAFSMVGPPERFRDVERQRQQESETGSRIRRLFDAYADELRLPVPEVLRLMRLLTFSASHVHVNDGEVLPPEVIVHTILYGVAVSPGDSAQPVRSNTRKRLKPQQIRGK